MATLISDPQNKEFVRMGYLDALVQAMAEEMERDPNVIMMGEDIPVYGVSKLVDLVDPSRLWPMPISEAGFAGVGIGAAIKGLRPIVDFTISSFIYLAVDQIISQAAKLHFMTGGQVRVPIVFRASQYYDVSSAAQHSDRPYSMFMNVPGLKIIAPTTPADAKGLLKSAIRDDDPVLVFEDVKCWAGKDEVPTDPDYLVPIGKAAITRKGEHVTLVGISGAMRAVEKAAKALEAEGIFAEVIDPRTLKPLDMPTIITSVRKTGRLVIVENAHRCLGAGAEIAASVAEEAFEALRKPIIRLATPDTHPAFSKPLEKGLYPTPEQIIAAVKRIV